MTNKNETKPLTNKQKAKIAKAFVFLQEFTSYNSVKQVHHELDVMLECVNCSEPITGLLQDLERANYFYTRHQLVKLTKAVSTLFPLHQDSLLMLNPICHESIKAKI